MKKILLIGLILLGSVTTFARMARPGETGNLLSSKLLYASMFAAIDATGSDIRTLDTFRYFEDMSNVEFLKILRGRTTHVSNDLGYMMENNKGLFAAAKFLVSVTDGELSVSEVLNAISENDTVLDIAEALEGELVETKRNL